MPESAERQTTTQSVPSTSRPPPPVAKALARVEDMELAVAGLRRELQAYVGVTGRDTETLRDFFTRIDRAVLEVAGAMNIPWLPGQNPKT